MMPVKKIMTSMFTSMAGNLFGGSLGNLFTAKPDLPVSTALPDTITINSPITVHANDTNSFAKTLKQTSKLAAGLMVKEMRKNRNMEKQFKEKIMSDFVRTYDPSYATAPEHISAITSPRANRQDASKRYCTSGSNMERRVQCSRNICF